LSFPSSPTLLSLLLHHHHHLLLLLVTVFPPIETFRSFLPFRCIPCVSPHPHDCVLNLWSSPCVCPVCTPPAVQCCM
jgi:hypothetical protein